MSVVLAIDAGTTGVRTRAVFDNGTPSIASYREFPQHFPQPGWVEHDPIDIWDAVHATLVDVARQLNQPIAAIGITNQRETVVAWNKSTGAPYGRAIVWQDRRTTDMCEELAPHLPLVRETTGLVLDPYFSASKISWILTHTDIARNDDLAIGTVDSWIAWNLTSGSSFVTDPSNASRTMLCDIRSLQWSDDMCSLFDVPRSALPDIVPSAARIGVTRGVTGIVDGIPISGIAGDQQAALFGQACVNPGMAKNTYGTGSFVLMNVGHEWPGVHDGMLTTVAWLINGQPTYAYEGSIFVTGAAVQWLRDGLGMISSSSEIEALASTVPDADGVFFVPAFAGLGSPWWDPHARAAMFGITRGTTRAHIARAAIDAMVFQTKDVIDAMTSTNGLTLSELRVDGGAAMMNTMLQLQADAIGVRVLRPIAPESTAMGAAYLAGLAEGVWSDVDEIASLWQLDVAFEPHLNETLGLQHAQWLRAVERSRHWLDAIGSTNAR
jgi:glycerol kinase